MFVCNLKLSKTNFFKALLGIMAIVCISLAGMGVFKMFSSNNQMETFRR